MFKILESFRKGNFMILTHFFSALPDIKKATYVYLSNEYFRFATTNDRFEILKNIYFRQNCMKIIVLIYQLLHQARCKSIPVSQP